MKRRCGAALLLLALSLTLTACQRDPGPPPDLRGQWRQVYDEEPEYYHLARITDDEVEIYYYTPSNGSTNLYWIGSFTPPEDGTEPYVWVSENRLPKNLGPRLWRYASRDETKEFTYKKGTLSYMIAPSQALRMNVTLERAEEDVDITEALPSAEPSAQETP